MEHCTNQQLALSELLILSALQHLLVTCGALACGMEFTVQELNEQPHTLSESRASDKQPVPPVISHFGRIMLVV